MPDEATTCRCQGGCGNRRCRCFQAGQACGQGCRCTACANPFNQMAGLEISDCAREHIARVAGLSAADRRQMVELPCGCEEVPLELLFAEHECTGCGEFYWYSFCWDQAVQDGDTWHCEVCRTCRDWREWHCPRCNRCTYGQSLPCEGCGGRSELARYIGGDE